MRVFTLIVSILFCTSFWATAQDEFHVGVAPGFSLVRASGSDNMQQPGLGQGIFARGTFSWDLHKKWLEGGVGLELGKMSGRVSVRDTIIIYGQSSVTWKDRGEDFASPYGTAYALLKVKQQLRAARGDKYLYATGIMGMMMTRSGVLYRATCMNVFAGLAGGIVFPIDNITGLDLGIGWRRIRLNGGGYNPHNPLMPGLPEHLIEGISLKYVSVSVGLVVHFESRNKHRPFFFLKEKVKKKKR